MKTIPPRAIPFITIGFSLIVFLLISFSVVIRTKSQATVLGTTDEADATPTVCQAKCCQGITVISTEPNCAATINAKCDVYSGLEDSSYCALYNSSATNPTPYPISSYTRDLSVDLFSKGFNNAIKGNAYHDTLYVYYYYWPDFLDDDTYRNLITSHEVTVQPTEALPAGLVLTCPTSLNSYSETEDNRLRICSIDGTPTVSGKFTLKFSAKVKDRSDNTTYQRDASFPLTID